MLTVNSIAKICHQANKAYCELQLDASQPDWDVAPSWQIESAIKGVEFCLDNPDAPPSVNHESWLKQKTDEGWVYGEVKDAINKTHPCCVPYDKLPEEQKAKDYLFKGIVDSLRQFAFAKELR